MRSSLPLLVLLVDACAPAEPTEARPPRAPAPETSAPAEQPDACGASRYQHLVGRPKSEIPPKPAGAVWRVHSTTQPVTMDYSENRMNIVWDAKTGIVKTVRCG
jgi:hypothetical protein